MILTLTKSNVDMVYWMVNPRKEPMTEFITRLIFGKEIRI